MSRWSGLPASLDHRVRQLVVRLRRLKDHSGLSLAALAARTPYSKSSWERYLNGKKLPPAGAVEALARLCGADVTRLLVLHEVAAQAWSVGRPVPEARPQVQAAQPATPVQPLPPGRSRPSPRAARDEAPLPAVHTAAAPAPAPATGLQVPLGPLVLGALAVLVVALPVLRPWQDHLADGRGTGAAMAGRALGAAPEFTPRPGETFDCRLQRRDGALYAGHSRTATTVLSGGAEGWDVVEAQCLLRRHGYDPGAVDGVVGGRTLRAVQRLQAGAGLPTDGIVGPGTWKALRR
ncbi:helix-turn-helix domain-containing protein [Streptomyces platensis]|uniref:helix-turn-helix domain-containing protein n=1 Tax=Streptomyces platensis TaxID=58346 RepID=UPI003C2BEEA8